MIIFGADISNTLLPEEQSKSDKDLVTNMLNLVEINLKDKIVTYCLNGKTVTGMATDRQEWMSIFAWK